MKIHPDWITASEEAYVVGQIASDMELHKVKLSRSRNRILRYGWDYSDPSKWTLEIPLWLPHPPHGFGSFDNVTINEYLKGQAIPAHTDSLAFGDVAILSMVSDAVLRFTHPTSKAVDYKLPARSLAIMSGELRTDWRHEMLPLEGDVRYSAIFRKKL